MKKILLWVNRAVNFVYRILFEYAKVVMLIVVLIIAAQVVARKFLKNSIQWSEEVALVFMVWTAFISLAIGVANDLHMSVELFYKRFSPKVRKAIDKFNMVVTFAIGIMMMNEGISLIKITARSTLPATKWPSFMLYLMIPVGGFFTAYYAFFKIFELTRFLSFAPNQQSNVNEEILGVADVSGDEEGQEQV